MEERALDAALAFVRAVEAGRPIDDLVAPGVIEEELPNRFFPAGMTRDLAAMRAGTGKGQTLFRSQRYLVRRSLGDARCAALEVEWLGELAVAVGGLAAGETMRAHIAFFFDVEAGRVTRIRHYDCFDPMGAPAAQRREDPPGGQT